MSMIHRTDVYVKNLVTCTLFRLPWLLLHAAACSKHAIKITQTPSRLIIPLPHLQSQDHGDEDDEDLKTVKTTTRIHRTTPAKKKRKKNRKRCKSNLLQKKSGGFDGRLINARTSQASGVFPIDVLRSQSVDFNNFIVKSKKKLKILEVAKK